LDRWDGTEFVDFLRNSEKNQTINTIEPGGFRYVSLAKQHLWGKDPLEQGDSFIGAHKSRSGDNCNSIIYAITKNTPNQNALNKSIFD
jgi:hypothetical protein